MATQTFKQLLVWQKAHEFVLAVYKYTNSFPKAEIYGLTSQFKRAAISIAANIAKGYKKKGKADKARLMNIAQGSFEECRYYLILATDLGYGENSFLINLLDEIGTMLQSYISKILTSNS
ncbi:MAG TPA: four helix bundle protein [Chitinophagaceae bacterium]|jgi:four helix bundle protein|nr:four helix bundle protein [Chitinophagaceae bacterium]